MWDFKDRIKRQEGSGEMKVLRRKVNKEAG